MTREKPTTSNPVSVQYNWEILTKGYQGGPAVSAHPTPPQGGTSVMRPQNTTPPPSNPPHPRNDR